MQYLDLILAHWPILVAWGVFYVITKALKDGPLSSKRAEEVRWVRFFRRWIPMPVLPILMGVGVGHIPNMPASPGVEGTSWVVWYYTGAGVAAVVWRDFYREWQKYRGQPG
jgi:hypothetical protein